MRLTRKRTISLVLAAIGLGFLFLTAFPGTSYATSNYLNVTSYYTPAPPAPFDVLDVRISISEYSKVDTLKVSLNGGPEDEIVMPDSNWIYHWTRSGLNLGSDKVSVKGYQGSNLVETHNFLVNSAGGLTEVVSIPISDLAGTAGDGQVSFTFTAPTGATSVKLRQKIGDGMYTDSATTQTLDENSTTAVVTGLTNGTAYTFKLIVVGGMNAGESNEVTVVPASWGFTISGRILLEGDNQQTTGSYYSGDVVVTLKQELDVKYTTTTSAEQNLTNNGMFTIPNVVPGSYTVVLSKKGYVKRTFDITVNSDTVLTTSSVNFNNRLYLIAGDIVQDQYDVIGPSDIGYMLSKYKTDRTQGTLFDESVDIYKDQYDVIGPADIGMVLKNYKFDATKYLNDVQVN